jgi:hypothetical protein
MFKKLWLRVRYRKQLKQGFALLSDMGAPREFNLVDGKLFIVNGVDPLVKVDLSTNKVSKYKPPTKGFTYTYKITNGTLPKKPK